MLLPGDGQAVACALCDIESNTQQTADGARGKFRGLTLSSHFQPIIGFDQNRHVGFEALMRTEDAHGQIVPPMNVFDSVSNEAEVVLLDRLCRNLHVRNFMAAPENNHWLFMNVNPQVIVSGKDYGPYFRELLEHYRVPASRIVIEILERGIDNEGRLSSAVQYYKDLGCLVAIDDFGSGYSNFNRIWQLEPDIVKLDRSIISQAEDNRKLRSTLPNLVSMIHESGSLAVIEGVETEAQALIAMDAGADLAQGYYFARPSAMLVPENNTYDVHRLHEKFCAHVNDEINIYYQRMDEYIYAFNQAADTVTASAQLQQVCADLLHKPNTVSCYLLDGKGLLLGDMAYSDHAGRAEDPRFAPLKSDRHTLRSRWSYFRRAMRRPGENHISKPYLSTSDARMHITLSRCMIAADQLFVFCCDIDWSEPGHWTG